MEKLGQEVNQVKVKDGTRDQQQAVKVTMMVSELDKEEIKNTYEEQNQFIELAMRLSLVAYFLLVSGFIT